MRILSVMVLLVLVSGPAGADELKDLGEAPDFTLPVHGGGKMTLSEVWKEGPVVVDFWATWCAPCKRALPRYQAIYDKYREQGLSILAVSQDDPRSQAKIGAFFKSQKLTFPALLDGDKKAGRLFGVQTLPVTIVISQEGRVVAVHNGYRDGDERVLERQIVELLSDRPEPAGR